MILGGLVRIKVSGGDESLLAARVRRLLIPARFDLVTPPPTVTIKAAYSKHRRRDVLPLHPELVELLRVSLIATGPTSCFSRSLGNAAPGSWSRKTWCALG